VRDLLAQAGFDAVHSRRDLAGIERISGGRRPEGAPAASAGPVSVPGV
jgi:release factor glutamine methyltransferase